MADLQKTISILFNTELKGEQIFRDINKEIGTLDSSFGGLGGRAADLTADLLLVGTAVTAAAVAFAGFAAKEAADFETGIANINTLLKGTAEDDLPAIEAGIKSLALEVPTSLADLTGALYDIQSGTGAGADGLNILAVAAKGAVGGLSDAKTSAAALITVLNSYNLTAADSDRIMDIILPHTCTTVWVECRQDQ